MGCKSIRLAKWYTCWSCLTGVARKLQYRQRQVYTEVKNCRNVVSFPCGILLSIEELFGSVSLSQVPLPIYSLMNLDAIRNNVKGKTSFGLVWKQKMSTCPRKIAPTLIGIKNYLLSSLDLYIPVLVHDNSCKFAAFVRNRQESSAIMTHLASLDYRVDRHHFKVSLSVFISDCHRK